MDHMDQVPPGGLQPLFSEVPAANVTRLGSIADHTGFHLVSSTEELLSNEVAGPLVRVFAEEESIPQGRRPLPAGERVFGARAPRWLQNTDPYTARAVYAARFAECLLHPKWGVVLPESRMIYEPSTNAARWKSPDLTQMPGVTLSRGGPALAGPAAHPRLEGAHIVLNHWGGRNYGHFLFDCVPGLLLFSRAILQGDLKIVTDPLNAWQREILDLLGIRGENIQTVTTDYCVCERLVWPSFLQGNLHQPASFTTRAAEWLRRSVRPADSGRRMELIYISRSGFSNRVLVNEPELIARLEPLGFSVIRPEEHTVAQQISMFSSARVVIGAVGAGLANLMFASRGCKVIEIMPEIKHSTWIKRWCALRDLDWHCVYAEVPPQGRHQSVVDGVSYQNLYFQYSVNPADLLQAVRNAMQADPDWS